MRKDTKIGFENPPVGMSPSVLEGIEKSMQDQENEVHWAAYHPGMGPLLGRWTENTNGTLTS